jgi:hypothetical protein
MSWNLRVRSARSGDSEGTRSGCVLSAALGWDVSGCCTRKERGGTVCMHLESAVLLPWKRLLGLRLCCR